MSGCWLIYLVIIVCSHIYCVNGDGIELDSDLLQIYIANSTLPGLFPGLGVFAKYDMIENEILCELRGVAVAFELRDHIHSDKLFITSTTDRVKWALRVDSLCGYANDAAYVLDIVNGVKVPPYTLKEIEEFESSEYRDSIPTYPGFEYNAKYIQQLNGKIFIVATRNINKDEEIFYSYGK